MGEDRDIPPVIFVLTRVLINCRVSKDYLVSGLFIIGTVVGSFLLDLGDLELLDDLFDLVLEEPLE